MNRPVSRPELATLSALGITVLYAITSGGWIAFSDRLLAILVADRELYTQLQTGKGWVFVAVSSTLIYGLVSRREEELAARNSQLERTLQQTAVLHRILRHNLRNSCNVVKGYIGLLGADADPSEAEAISVIERNVEDLIRLSEKSHHLREIVLERSDSVHPVNLNALLDEQIAAIEAEHPDVVVHKEMTEPRFVRAHSRLGVGIFELFENATVHNDAETPTIWISIRSEVDDTIDLDIADNGSGIPEIEREVIEQGEEKPLFHSQGIGLWVARAAIVESGGEIRIVDNDPEGSVARITLPKASSPE
ncbi:ATP-binding protein [Halobellus sp. GM3]|uniref:ATP-binding protein n=1 Tax=Halobellus sp. GM3 TaxID=3458410 RepID=UPI00403DD329